ncbi:MAG: DUF1819 family protein [Proteobacteria bacterium]|nr:DUF1819 family protein [Pseudomonadota bacterium]MBU1686344.1 DUF1819 family protein [Pseudomonadota bacterium]
MAVVSSAKYQMSFTTGGLFLHESLLAVDLYLLHRDWKKVRDLLLSGNLIQARTISSAQRVTREICQRLSLLTLEQLQLLFSGTTQERQGLLWVAVCKRYSFIKDFMTEIVRENFLRLNMVLHPSDYDMFFHDKEEWHDELARLSQTTKAKLRQVLHKIMHEAEILTKDDTIIPAILTARLAQVLVADNPDWLRVFAVSDSDLNEWL